MRIAPGARRPPSDGIGDGPPPRGRAVGTAPRRIAALGRVSPALVAFGAAAALVVLAFLDL